VWYSAIKRITLSLQWWS